MKKPTFPAAILALSLLMIISFYSCEKYDKNIEGDICIYLLDEFNTKVNSYEIISDGIVLSEDPILYYGDLIEYNADEHIFKLSESGTEKTDELFGSAYAVTIDGEIIYTGYFWSSLSSAIVDWVVMDVLGTFDGNELHVQLGYPWLSNEMDIPDNRNDNRILSVFARDEKLID